MSFHTQAKKRHNAGRSHLSNAEKKIPGTRWYYARSWVIMKQEIATKVAKRVARATSRRAVRELAKRKAVLAN